MPLPKQIPSLENLYFDNVAQNIAFHSELFNNCAGEEIFNRYEKLKTRCHFSKALLKRLFEIYNKNRYHEDEKLRTFIRYMFLGDTPGNLDVWSLFEFFFNRRTIMIDPPIDTEVKCELPRDVSYHILSHCKLVAKVSKSFSKLAGRRFVENISVFRYLHVADLGSIGDTEILKSIFKECDYIGRLTADCSESCEPNGISDRFLLSLCRYCWSEEFVFCPENGACSRSGKRLVTLRIMLCSTENGEGIACALQHLPQLKDFVQLPSFDFRWQMRQHCLNVIKGIEILQRAAAFHGKPIIILELTDLFFDYYVDIDILRIIFLCCPKMESVQLSVIYGIPHLQSFPNLKRIYFYGIVHNTFLYARNNLLQLMSVRGKQIEALGFIFAHECVMEANVLNDIFSSCQNLKELIFFYSTPVSQGQGDMEIMPFFGTNLEKICICAEQGKPQPNNTYLRELLVGARNVKILDICSPFAERELAEAMEVNDFCTLQNICIRGSDLSEMPFLNTLANARNHLSRIWFRGCKNTNACVVQLNDIARLNNYGLDIEERPHYLKDQERINF